MRVWLQSRGSAIGAVGCCGRRCHGDRFPIGENWTMFVVHAAVTSIRFAGAIFRRIFIRARTIWPIEHQKSGRVCDGCSKAEPQFPPPPQQPFPGAQDRQNLISWRWSLPAPTDPVWWRSMHAISSYRVNKHRPPATNTARPPSARHSATDRTDYNTLHRYA